MLDILRILHVYPHFSGWEVNFLLKDKALQRQSNAQCFQDIRRVDAKVVWCLKAQYESITRARISNYRQGD